MRIAVVNITGGGLSGGYRKYLQSLLPLMIDNEKVSRLDAYIPNTVNDLALPKSINTIKWPIYDSRNRFSWLKNSIKEMNPDVIFIPTGRWIGIDNYPVVVMIRNMEPLSVPFEGNPTLEKIKNIGRIRLAKKACINANRIIAVSCYVKDFLHNKWDIDTKKIGVVYHGVEIPIQKNISTIPNKADKLNNNKFVFTAGSIRPARGLEDIIEAHSIIHSSNNDTLLLVAGAVDKGMKHYKDKLDNIASRLGNSDSIKWLGNLNSDEMSWFYQNCKAFIMTSRTEACPNIALEAMAHGCICISTNSPPMPEIFGDAAIYYPFKDSHELADIIQSMYIWDIKTRAEMSEKAKSRAANFSWIDCAEKTIEELEKAFLNFS